ncbi:hypothetical protein ABID23_000240 [Bartonella silvatica]|uniref:Uncharacterized protein n=1 Tax=Bartonella silvatica TaxID=357760 RepID=A0ABV2HF55_9HYPH
MNHEGLFVFVLVIIAIFFFNAIAKMTKQGIYIPLRFPASQDTKIKGGCKSPLYKLWQYVTKDKSFRCGGGMESFGNKEVSCMQQLFISCFCFRKNIAGSRGDMERLAVMFSKKCHRVYIFINKFICCWVCCL